ncbi:MAG: alanine racemase [Xanthobacteraceae bacterium]
MTHASGPAAAEAGGILTIDLAAVAANWRALRARTAPAQCAAVIKADGYGCGIGEIATTLAQAGCETFFVANLAEARSTRAVASGASVYVLNGLLPGTAPAYAEANLRPVLGSVPEMEEWGAFRRGSGWRGGAALHFDTGMNRLGFPFEEAAQIAGRVGRDHGIALVMSHFACSEEDHPLNAIQMERFRAVRAQFPDIAGSLSNSSGIFLGPEAHHDLVRPGVALYGANPTPGKPNPIQSVVTLEARVVQLREVDEGATVGYSATWTAKRRTRLAVISIGYADGFLRAASASDKKPGAEAIVAGRRCPMAGRVSMDLIAIDVTGAPTPPQRGDLVTLLGNDITVDDLAERAGTIGYEVLTSLGRRYRRIYQP